MKKLNKTYLTGLAVSVSAIAVLAGAPAYAQDTDDPEEVASEPDGVSNDDPGAVTVVSDDDTGADGSANDDGTIVVTGSRVRRDTYTSISPLQVVTTEASQDVGLFDPSQILQRDEAASGTQIDSTFNGFVLNNGPGQQTLNLRGLGADRTLIMINGRRVAPSGVEGAPSAPSINLLPSSLVARYDLLLDGASSIYGSDAIAGVTNVILRTNFDGPELFASGSINPMGGGDDYQISGAYGLNFDRGFIGFGVEYDYRDEIRFQDRDFLAGCDTNYEITSTGEIRTIGLGDQNNALTRSNGTITSPASECKRAGYGLSGSIIERSSFFGVLYYDPATGGNSGIPNFSESTFFNGAPVDADGDGVQDISFADYSTNGAYPEGLFIPSQHRYTGMAYGEYELGGDANLTPFFEFLFSRVDVEADRTTISQIAPYVPDNNAFNPCNPFQPNGGDCFNQAAIFNFGSPLFPLPVPLAVTSRVGIVGDRDNFDTQIDQYRGVVGLRGDLPFVGSDWTFEISGNYQRSNGTSRRVGVREDRLALALGIDPTIDFDADGIIDNDGDGIADDYDQTVPFGNGIGAGAFGYLPPITPCDTSALANPELAAPDLADGCVPVNVFADSLLSAAVGDFASQAERDYLLSARDFTTTYEQIVLTGFVSGTLFELPAGPLGAVFGLEWREDSIDSRPDFVASNGLIYGFFKDRGAVGSKWIREAFGELNAPVFEDDFWGDFEVNLAGRVTDEEFYGTAFTYSAKAGWSPTDGVLLRASYGTSFRAPNLRENFLLGQTGFLGVFDPCAVPSEAFVSGTYRPDLDTRDPTTLANCIRENRDPTTIGITQNGRQVFQVAGIEIASIGSLELEPETSSSFTAGVSLEETYGDWRFSFGGTYYAIEIEDSIVRPGLQFAVNDCFTRQDGIRSQFCDQISASTAPGNLGLLSDAALDFLNIDTNTVRGLDFNATIGRDFLVGGETFDVGLNLRANHLIERSTLFIDAQGNESFDEDAGEFGLPKWTGRATLTLDWNDFRFTWQTRYLGEMNQSAAGVDPLSDNFGFGPDGERTGFIGDTCTGFGSGGPNASTHIVPGDGVFCRDIGYTGDYFEHAVSLRYSHEMFTLRLGVTNLFDRDPPLVDPDEVPLSVSNVPIGAGYNLDGREFFGSIQVRF